MYFTGKNTTKEEAVTPNLDVMLTEPTTFPGFVAYYFVATHPDCSSDIVFLADDPKKAFYSLNFTKNNL